jgi:hypothetical protein
MELVERLSAGKLPEQASYGDRHGMQCGRVASLWKTLVDRLRHCRG